MEVEGYVPCHQCGVWVLTAIAARTGGYCAEHFIANGSQRVGRLELVGRGGKMSIPRGGKRRTRPMTEERKRRRSQAQLAKRRARKRLAAIFPDTYDMLVAEERAGLGLEPWTIDAATQGGDPMVEVGFAEMLNELDERGVAV